MFYGQLFHVDHQRLTQLSRSQMLTYTALISHGGKDRTFTGSQSKLANIANVSLGSVKRALKHFEEQGWMTTTDFYQVKKYTLNRPDIDQSLDLPLDHSLDLPSNNTVDHSCEPPLDHSLEPSMDHSCDLHVIKNKKEYNSFHDMTAPTTKSTFQNFLQRWTDLQGWKMDRPMEDVWRLFSETPNVNHELEIKVVDSWLMVQYHLQNGRCWSFGWFERLSTWFKRENEVGGRQGLNLNPQQRYFLNFAVTETTIPTPPVFETESLAVKEAPSEKPKLHLVEDDTQEEDFGFVDMIEAAKTSPTLQKILKEKGII